MYVSPLHRNSCGVTSSLSKLLIMAHHQFPYPPPFNIVSLFYILIKYVLYITRVLHIVMRRVFSLCPNLHSMCIDELKNTRGASSVLRCCSLAPGVLTSAATAAGQTTYLHALIIYFDYIIINVWFIIIAPLPRLCCAPC